MCSEFRILTISVLFYYVSVRSIVMPVTILLFYYVSVRSEFRIVMPVTISVLFYYVSVRSEFRIVMPVTIVMLLCVCTF